ncbi:VOC family protein [Nocardia arthritidis]|uniref:VOC family protein n=1 Tax=Nocardia arthritidis TaxID=228602 RepID=A0A6G9YJ23_9NOCA|nr:VOC family protein [Nocardia arthritidis]QIS12943.1 hypothetical protein F5544_25445 [Nocardia arthritidis]
MPTIPANYHAGVVVNNLEQAMSELTEMLGLDWGPVLRSGHQILGKHGIAASGDGIGPLMTISNQGPPYIELLQRVPDTIWDRPGLHHLGFWSADARGDSDLLSSKGFPLQAAAVVLSGDTDPGVFYHRTSEGLYLELVEMGRGGPGLAHYLNFPGAD